MTHSYEDISRILEAFAYIVDKAPENKKNMYNILKVFYLADKIHMENYGRFIFNDRYIAMPKGPVPSLAYDLMKDLKTNGKSFQNVESPVTFIEKFKLCKLRDANIDYFSRTDLECIDKVIELSKYEDLGDLSHDIAWQKTVQNKTMDMTAIISTLKDSDALIELYQNRYS